MNGQTSMRDAMMALSDVIGIPIIWPGDRAPSPEEMRDLPPTSDLEQSLARAEKAAAGGRGFGLGRDALQTDLRRAQYRLKWGRYRDEYLQTRRYPCKCFGDGKVPTEAHEYDPTDNAFRYCPCAAGKRLRREHGQRVEESAQERAQMLLADLFSDGGEEYRQYREMTFHSYADAAQAFGDDVWHEAAELTRWLAAWAEADHNPWLVLHGPTGTGKTGLAVVMLAAFAGAGTRSMVVAEKAMLDSLRATYNRNRYSDEPTESDVLRTLRSVPVLLLDDVGAPGSAVSEWAQGQLLDVLNRRYAGKLRTVLTTNLDPNALAAYLGDRIWSRLQERTDGDRYMIEVARPDLRRRGA